MSGQREHSFQNSRNRVSCSQKGHRGSKRSVSIEVLCLLVSVAQSRRKQGSPRPHRQNRASRGQAKKTRTSLSPLGGTGAGGAQLSSATGAAQGGDRWGAAPCPLPSTPASPPEPGECPPSTPHQPHNQHAAHCLWFGLRRSALHDLGAGNFQRKASSCSTSWVLLTSCRGSLHFNDLAPATAHPLSDGLGLISGPCFSKFQAPTIS